MAFDPFKTTRDRKRPSTPSPKKRAPSEESGGEAGMPVFLRESVPSHTPVGPTIQRMPKEGEPAAAPAPDPTTAALGLIVDSEVAAPGQMTRTEFLAELRAAIYATAEDALSGTIWSVVGCPWMDHWFGYYGGRNAGEIERAIIKYAPEASGARTAGELIPMLCGRVRTAIGAWSATGEMPEGAGDVPTNPEGANSALPGMAFKRGGSGAQAGDAGAARTQLGGGRSLDAPVRSRMESAFGRDFSRVRVHTGEAADNLSDRYGARAFTVSGHIAFGRGEYQPGTPIGDALIAHELAHVAQQEGAASTSISSQQPSDNAVAEEEADRSAIHAVGLFAGGGGLSDFGKRAMQLTRSGLRLQRCKSARQKEIERLAGVQWGYLEEKRKKDEEEKKKTLEEEAKKRGEVNPAPVVEVKMDDVIKQEVAKGAIPVGPDAAWTGLSDADKADWTNRRAPAAWARVVASVKGTELEKVMDGWTFSFEPQYALSKNFYAWSTINAKVFHFGMSWVQDAEADPKSVWPNVAHEIGGHFEYGRPYSSEIMDEALSKLPEAEREKWRTDPVLSQQFYENYSYPETEIYSELRARRYSNPETGAAPVYGGMKPDVTIPDKLAIMHGALAPEVAKAVLTHLKEKVDASPDILPRDKKYFLDQVKAVFGYDL